MLTRTVKLTKTFQTTITSGGNNFTIWGNRELLYLHFYDDDRSNFLI